MIFPSIEELYDMNLDNLLILKKNIENNKIVNNIPLDENDLDFYDENNFYSKETMLKFVENEINERNQMNNILNFFLKSDINQILNENENFNENFNKNENENFNKNENEIFNEKNKILNENKKILNENLNEKNKIKKENENIKDLLNRTKIDTNKFQYVVAASNLMKPINFYKKIKKIEPIIEKKIEYKNYLPLIKKNRKQNKKIFLKII